MKDLDSLISELRGFLNKLFSSYDPVWRLRCRKLDSRLMFSAIFAHVLSKDATNSRLISNHLDFLTDSGLEEFGASSFSKARRRFPFQVFTDLCQWLYRFHEIPEEKRWFGYSIFAVDSTKFDVPRELAKEGFDSMNDCESYYPQAMLTAMYDLQKGMIYDSIVSQHGDERANAVELFQGLPTQSLVLGDSGFPSFDFLYEAEKADVKLLLRISEENAAEELKEFIQSDSKDEIITITPSLPTERKAIRHGHIPRPIEVRAIKYKIKGSLFVVITTLIEKELSKEDIKRLYWTRWDIEEHFKLSKIGLRLESFKAKHLEGVLQEVWATQALTILCRCLALCSKPLRGKEKKRTDYSLLGISKILKTAFFPLLFSKPSRLAVLLEKVNRGLDKVLVKFRPGRQHPRQSRGRATRWGPKAEGVSC